MTETPASVVIVGAGLAGAKTAEALRERGYAGPVTLVGAESELPYERPPLSKDFLAGKAEFADAHVHPEDWYAAHDVTLRLNAEVTAVRTGTTEIELIGGERIGYGALVLATGSSPRVLSIPGAEDALYLRTRADSEALQQRFGEGQRLVIIGAGWIGLEAAAAARDKGTTVTVIESAELPLLGALGREMATVFAELHRAHDVDLRLSTDVAAIRPDGVTLADGTDIPADAVLVGVGALPNLELASSAALDIDDGVLVDAQLRSSDPAIWAVGDIASVQHPVLEQRVRVEHWATALNQPAVAAAALLGGPDTWTELPYFFSDQYDLGMEYIGLAAPGSYARVLVRGDLAAREFVAFWLDTDNRVLAAMNVNVWDVVDEIKPLIADRIRADPDKLTDPDVPYSQLAAD